MDTGVDYLHQELNGVDKFQTIYTTYDENSPPSTDEKRNGTHVAAIIAGEKEGSGMHGVAFGSKILFIEITFSSFKSSSAGLINDLIFLLSLN